MGDYFIELDTFPFENGFSVANKKYMTLHVGSGKDQWKAREYVDWPEVVMNLKNLYPELIVVQVGAADDFKVEGTNFDFRGLTKTPQNLAFLIKNACLHVGIDSFPMHLAAAMKTPLTAIFGCSVPTSSGPWVKDLANAKYILLSSERKSGCVDRPCYKHRCKVNPEGNGPINEIDPHEIFDACVTLIEGQN